MNSFERKHFVNQQSFVQGGAEEEFKSRKVKFRTKWDGQGKRKLLKV